MSIYVDKMPEIIKLIKSGDLSILNFNDHIEIDCNPDDLLSSDFSCHDCPLCIIDEHNETQCVAIQLSEEEELLYKLEISEEFI